MWTGYCLWGAVLEEFKSGDENNDVGILTDFSDGETKYWYNAIHSFVFPPHCAAPWK